MTGSTTAELIALLTGFEVGEHRDAERHRRGVLDLLRESSDPFSRTNYRPGHITASGIVLSPERTRVLLVFHHRFQQWLQPGGHVDATDADVIATARREIDEETGVLLTDRRAPHLVGVDVHEIPRSRGEPYHLHHDLTFLFQAADESVVVSGKTSRVVWAPLDALSGYGADEPLQRNVRRARRAFDCSSPIEFDLTSH